MIHYRCRCHPSDGLTVFTERMLTKLHESQPLPLLCVVRPLSHLFIPRRYPASDPLQLVPDLFQQLHALIDFPIPTQDLPAYKEDYDQNQQYCYYLIIHCFCAFVLSPASVVTAGDWLVIISLNHTGFCFFDAPY